MKRLALWIFLLGSSVLGQAQTLQIPRYDVPPKRYALDARALSTDLKEFQGEALLVTRTLSDTLEQTLLGRLGAQQIQLKVFVSSDASPTSLAHLKNLKKYGAAVYQMKGPFGRGTLIYGEHIAYGTPVDGRGNDGQMLVSRDVAQTMRLQLEGQLKGLSTPL